MLQSIDTEDLEDSAEEIKKFIDSTDFKLVEAEVKNAACARRLNKL